jgi:ATP-dependent DNA helicase DinG
MMAARTKPFSARQFFTRDGVLARAHPGFEYRPGQLQMALAVESALAEGKHLLVEAGTGTGKTMAYLIPAVLSGKRVVVSTGTKNLQEQLYFKDVPLLARPFKDPLRVCYMKGRSNYLCRQKLYDAEREPLLTGLEEAADYQVIKAWEQTTETGDRAEIRTLPEASSAWGKLDARRELCTGQKCVQFDRCFLTLMHRRAAESDLIIVNHHLFFADLAVKEQEFGSIIPKYDAVIFDEAHEIEDVAGQYFGVSLSSYQIEDLIRDITRLLVRKELTSIEMDRALLSLSDASLHFFANLPAAEGRAAFRDRQGFLDRHAAVYVNFLTTLDLVGGQLEAIEGATDEIAPLIRRTAEHRQNLEFLLEGGGKELVYWIDRRARSWYLQATPIDVSGLLQDKLFNRVRTVVLASATLAVGGDFRYIESRVGAQGARTLVVPGHFDYRRQALLYIPRQMPDPRSPQFPPAAADEIIRLLQITEGRAFVLFTSYQQMRLAHDRVSLAVEYPVLLQGTGPRSALLEEFRATPNCVLFATSSFWQGVDVPGDQLSCVIIDKLPFAVPSDPVVEARINTIREAQGVPFYEYQVPQAAIALKQGFGRLIRTGRDRGVLALLDNRVLNRRYGEIFLTSLPEYGFTTDLDEVKRFFHV